jgi:uncharacterized protein
MSEAPQEMEVESDVAEDLPGDDTAAEETGPRRRCVATGAVGEKDAMIRFVASPDGEVFPDLEEKLPGRGMWLTADAAAVALAMRRNAFSKAARRSLRVPADLAAQLDRLLERRCLDRIGLARRAGQLVAGYEKVREALKNNSVGRSGPPALLVEAADGSPDQRGKVTALAPRLPVVTLFGGDALANALGREVAVHAVVARGGLADALLRDARRLAGLRGGATGGAAQAGQDKVSGVGAARPDMVTT